MDILEQTLETSQDEIRLKGEDIDDPKAMVDSTDLQIIEDEGSISDDQTADNLANAQAILDADDGVQYQWKSSEGVTYRVVHVNPDEHEVDPLSSYNSTSGNLQSGTAVLAGGLSSNHFYVIGNTNEMFNSQTQRSLTPRAGMTIENRGVPVAPLRVRRDDRRRATHNEVERRRRDKINNWISKLSKIIPDCNSLDTNKSVQSKGGILAKACEYIVEQRDKNLRLVECIKEKEKLSSHVDYLRSQNEKLKMENSLLRSTLEQNGLSVAVASQSRSSSQESSSDSLVKAELC